MKKFLLACLLLINGLIAFAENGYELWLRYRPLPSALQQAYRPYFQRIFIASGNTSSPAIKKELSIAIPALLGIQPVFYTDHAMAGNSGLYINTDALLHPAIKNKISTRQQETGSEGFYL